MTNIAMQRALAAPMLDGADVQGTVRDYLETLLLTLWDEEEGFDGKRPFGNSGWQNEVYAALVSAGCVPGVVDADGYLDDVDEDAAGRLVHALIRYVFAITEM